MPLLAFLFAFAAALFATGSLSGSWSGGGSVHYSNKRERARCRATYSHVSGTLYRMSASCSTPSGHVNQTATVNRVGNNEYAGNFHNSQYNVSGSIHIRLRGKSQSVSLNGGSLGGGNIKLTRR